MCPIHRKRGLLKREACRCTIFFFCIDTVLFFFTVYLIGFTIMFSFKRKTHTHTKKKSSRRRIKEVLEKHIFFSFPYFS